MSFVNVILIFSVIENGRRYVKMDLLIDDLNIV